MFTERLFIKQVKYPLDDQVDWLNDPRNTMYSEQRHVVHDKTSCANYIRQCSAFWGIQEVSGGEWIGTMAAHIDEYNEVAELGILIHHEYAGKGYGVEAWKAATDYLLKKVRKVEAGCMATNTPMTKLLKKSNYFFEGERKGHFLVNGAPIGLTYYGKWR